MAKYLDMNGVQHLWNKINEKIEPFTSELLKITLSKDTGGGGYNYCDSNR